MENSKFDEKIVGNFIAMSQEMGTETFDRLRFSEFTVLLNKIDTMLISYVFKGESYNALQKLNSFIENLKENREILQKLSDSTKNNQCISKDEIPALEVLIRSCFVGDSKKIQLPFKAYKGEEPFIFVSYSHSDKLQVYPIMDYLNQTGFNIWYDEGISVSEDWKKSIVNSIENCTAFLVFITPHIIDSKYVRREISFALDNDKPFFAVYLKDIELPSELKFEISDIQSMKKYTMLDDEFYVKIKEVLSPILSKNK
jgi:hypothetical protein